MVSVPVISYTFFYKQHHFPAERPVERTQNEAENANVLAIIGS